MLRKERFFFGSQFQSIIVGKTYKNFHILGNRNMYQLFMCVCVYNQEAERRGENHRFIIHFRGPSLEIYFHQPDKIQRFPSLQNTSKA